MSKEFRDNFELVKVSQDIYALVRSQDDSALSGYGVNQAFVVLEDSVLAFDSGFTLAQAKSLDISVKSITENKIRYLVNSHDHSDHVFGNSYFYKKYSPHGIHIISHSNCASNLRSGGSRRMRSYRRDKKLRNSLSTLDIKIPDLTYELDLHLEIEGTNFVFIHPENGAHTLGDTLLALPENGVLLAGDVLFNSYFPNLQDANLESWIDFLNDADFQTYRKFVPGHGDICDQHVVQGFTKYLQNVRDLLLSNNVQDEKNIRGCFELDGTSRWLFRSAVDMNVRALSVKSKNHADLETTANT